MRHPVLHMLYIEIQLNLENIRFTSSKLNVLKLLSLKVMQFRDKRLTLKTVMINFIRMVTVKLLVLLMVIRRELETQGGSFVLVSSSLRLKYEIMQTRRVSRRFATKL